MAAVFVITAYVCRHLDGRTLTQDKRIQHKIQLASFIVANLIVESIREP